MIPPGEAACLSTRFFAPAIRPTGEFRFRTAFAVRGDTFAFDRTSSRMALDVIPTRS
jgi:hypothetical protein